MITFTFKTIGGPQVVEITDEKVSKFIEAASNCKDEYGDRPEHPIDFCQIAYQLYLAGKIDQELKDYLFKSFADIMKNFKYDDESLVCDIPDD
jgi:hypothetical protein